MSKLSSALSAGNGWPTKEAKVRIKSVRMIGSSEVSPAGALPGQRTMKGTRWPASQASAFIPRHGREGSWPKAFTEPVGPLMPTPLRCGEPLSLVKMTRVRSAAPVRSSADRTWPSTQSTSLTKSP